MLDPRGGGVRVVTMISSALGSRFLIPRAKQAATPGPPSA